MEPLRAAGGDWVVADLTRRCAAVLTPPTALSAPAARQSAAAGGGTPDGSITSSASSWRRRATAAEASQSSSSSAAELLWPLTLQTSEPATSSNAKASGECVLEPDQERGGEDLAGAVHVVVGADEDLVALVDRLRLLLDPLALAEHVLGRVHEPEPEAPLAEQLLIYSAVSGSWVIASVKWT